jgi:two-component system sensor histidine kinase NreB
MPAPKEDLIFAVVIVAVTFFILSAFIFLVLHNYYKSKVQKEKEILHAVFQAQENERNRISEDLHDDIGSKLSALKIQNEVLRQGNDLTEFKNLADKNAGIIDLVVKNIRGIIRNQASKFIIDNGIVQELEQLRNQYMAANNIRITLNLHHGETRFKNDFEVNLFRILQELLHNSTKHAACSEIKINTGLHNDELHVFYSDNGRGFEMNGNGSESMGMKNIKARIELFKGKSDFKSIPDVETSYSIKYKMKNIVG